MNMSQEEFKKKFKGSAVKRAKRRGLLRNIAVALGNWKSKAAMGALIKALSDSEPLVRGHAAWALGQIGGEKAQAALKNALEKENEPQVIEEIQNALKKMENGEWKTENGKWKMENGSELPRPKGRGFLKD
jgi:epoxyqueuosine reductase